MNDVHELLLAHHSWLRRLAADLVRAESADDVVQETLRIAIERPPARSDTLRVWLQRVAANVVRRMHRTEVRRRGHEQVHAAGGEPAVVPSPAQLLARQQLAVTVAAAVRDLDEPYRTAIHLRYYEDLGPHAIAARTATSVATVKTRLRRAREQLRTSLDRRAGREHWQAGLLALPAPPPGVASTALAMTTKTKLWLAGALALLAALPFAFRRADGTAPAGPVPPPAAAAPADAAPGAGAVRRPDLPREAAPPRGIHGKAVLANGEAVAGARFSCFVGPHPDGDRGRWSRAETVSSAADGTFALTVDDGIEALFLLADERWEFAGEPRTVTAVAPQELTVELRSVPAARLLVRAHDLATGQPLLDFTCRFLTPDSESDWPTPGQEYRGGSSGAVTTTGEIEHFVAVRGGAVARVQVDLVEPGKARERVVVRAGETRVVQLGHRTGDRIRGVVVDGEGKPIGGALVFAGTQVRARGDEPGKPFAAERIRDGVSTDAAGAFEIAASTFVTAWHREHSSRTVRIADARRIVLEPRATIRGRLLDAVGRPRPATGLRLDRTTIASTDAEGAFRFADVESGTRVVYVPGDRPTKLSPTLGGPWLVHARAGEVVDATLAAGIPELRLDLRGLGDAKAVALVGLSTGTSLAVGEPAGGLARLSDVVAGDYHLVTDRGALLRVRVTGPELAIAPGQGDSACWLVVATDDGGTFHAVPGDADPVLRSVVARMVRLRRDANATIRIGPLAPGEYELCRGDEPAGEPVFVSGAETRVRWP